MFLYTQIHIESKIKADSRENTAVLHMALFNTQMIMVQKEIITRTKVLHKIVVVIIALVVTKANWMPYILILYHYIRGPLFVVC